MRNVYKLWFIMMLLFLPLAGIATPTFGIENFA